jgi:hypothetical protein
MADAAPFKVQHLMWRDGMWLQAVSDLIFRDGQPIAVLEWGGTPDNELPLVSVPLDPKRLTEFRSGTVTHLYDGQIEDPREAPHKTH